jgi:NCAIR mutase (PurE)-related protein
VSTGKKNVFGGWLSLLGTLSSESAGLVVVGIDNGAGAGFAAARIINSRSNDQSVNQ